MTDRSCCHYCRMQNCECPQTTADAVEYIRKRSTGVSVWESACRMLLAKIKSQADQIDQLEATLDACQAKLTGNRP